jgi:cytochrome oxidase assembly protein ShyY1
MYRFLLRPKWIGFHLLVLTGVVTMVNLGLWQLDRLDHRRAFNATVEARYDAAPKPIDEVLTAGADPDDVEWLPVTAVGQYQSDRTVRIVNRSQNGFAGDNIVDPLRLTDGRLLLVNRGFLAQGLDLPRPSTGEVTVTGRLRPSQGRRLGQLSDPETGRLAEAQRVDLDRLARQLDGVLLPMYVDAFESSPADSNDLQPVVAPDRSEGPHLSYAIQWFIFAASAVVGWVLAVRRSAASRLQQRHPAELLDHVGGDVSRVE